MTDISSDIHSMSTTSYIDNTSTLQPAAIHQKIINTSLQNISNTNTRYPDLMRTPFRIPETASWMTADTTRSSPNNDYSRPSSPPLLANSPPDAEPTKKAKYTYHPDEFAIEENPPNMRNAAKMTRYHDFITHNLSEYEKELGKSNSYRFSKYAPDCGKIIREESKITQELRNKASEAYQEQKKLVAQAASELNNEKLSELIDEIAAICDPSKGKEFANFYAKAQSLFPKACKDATPYLLWEHLTESILLETWLQDSVYGQNILAELASIPPESDRYQKFSVAEMALINRIFAFCKPIDGLHFHDLYQLDLTGKSAHAIIHTLLNNKGIKEILDSSFYGRSLWKKLMNLPIIIDLFNHNQKIENNRKRIAQQQERLRTLQNRPVISRVLNAFKIRQKKQSIKDLKRKLRDDINVHEGIIMCKDNFFRYLQNLSHGDVYKTLRELSREDITLQNNIDSVIELYESAEKVMPTFLYRETKMVPFIHIARALTFCDVFTKNIGGAIEALTTAITQLYPSQDVRKFISDLENTRDEIPLILAAGYMLPPHINGEERQRKMKLLSQVISMREREEAPDIDPAQQAYLDRPNEWCADWPDPLDAHTLAWTVHVWLANQTPPGKEDILVQTGNKLATALHPDALARNLMVSVEMNEHLLKKLKITPTQKEIIKQNMRACMLARDEYADPMLRNARFKINIARLLGKLPEKLAWDLEKIRLTVARYHEIKYKETDILFTDLHLQTIDHLILYDAAIRNCMVARNALAELHDIYREVQFEEDDLELLYGYMEDILSGNNQNLPVFHQIVRSMLTEGNIEYLGYFDVDYYDKLTAIKKTLLDFSNEGLSTLFTTLNSTGVALSEGNIQDVTATICDYLFEESTREKKSSDVVLSLLFHGLFSGGKIVALPAQQTLSHAHENLDTLSSGLVDEMDRMIESEIDRILADFPPAKSKNSDYIKACCQLIDQPEQSETILTSLSSHQHDANQLSAREYSLLRQSLKVMLTTNPAEYQAICSKIISKLQQQRADKDLYWLASMVYWHDFFSLRRAGYLAVNSDRQRKKEIESIYELPQYIFLDELASDYSVWLNATGTVTGKLSDFIQETDKKYKISDSLAWQISRINKDVTNAMKAFDKEKRTAYRRATDEMNMKIGLAVHFAEVEWLRQKSDWEKTRCDMQNRFEKEIDIHNKYAMREWRNQYHQHVAESIALLREINWESAREHKQRIEKATFNKVRLGMAHAYLNREVYVVIAVEEAHKSRVIIHNSSGPVNHHDTYDEDEATTRYYAVKIKANKLNNNTLDLLTYAKPVAGAPQAATSWRPKPGEAPMVDGRKLMKITLQKTGDVTYKLFGVFSRYGDIPVKINQDPPNLDELMEKLKADNLRSPGGGKDSTARDNAATPFQASQSTAAPSAENAMVLPQPLARPWQVPLPPEPSQPSSSEIPPLPPQPEPAEDARPNKIGAFPHSTHLAHQIYSSRGWLGANAERVPYLISQTPMYDNKILVITDFYGKVTEAYDSRTGDSFDKAELLTTDRVIGAIRLAGDHYDAWLPRRANERHRFVTMQVPRNVRGGLRPTGTTYYLETHKSSIHKINKNGLCMTNAAAMALDLGYGIQSGTQLRSELTEVLSSGQYEEMLRQPTHYNASH